MPVYGAVRSEDDAVPHTVPLTERARQAGADPAAFVYVNKRPRTLVLLGVAVAGLAAVALMLSHRTTGESLHGGAVELELWTEFNASTTVFSHECSVRAILRSARAPRRRRPPTRREAPC